MTNPRKEELLEITRKRIEHPEKILFGGLSKDKIVTLLPLIFARHITIAELKSRTPEMSVFMRHKCVQKALKMEWHPLSTGLQTKAQHSGIAFKAITSIALSG